MSVYTTFKNFTDAELEQEDYRFNLKISNAELADEAWQELSSFFEQNPDLKDKYRHSYWRWFVILSWQKALPSSDAIFLWLIEEQAPMAILLNIDVVEVMTRYLAQNYYSREDIGSYFIKLQSAFLQSEAVVGKWKEKNVTVSEIVKEIDSIYKTGDSLAQADFESKLRQIMFPTDEMAKKYFTADPEEAKERFLDLVSFFETFTQENIWYVVDSFLNPEKYQNVSPGEAPVAAKTITPPKPPTPVVAKPPAPAAFVSKSINSPQPAQKKEEPKLVVPPTIRLKPSPAQIKSQIEKEFKIEDVDGIMGKLNELAEKNNDLSILDMYYYDESSGKFLWK